jgi:glycosyltransferase involved in cell wall biosynthesis
MDHGGAAKAALRLHSGLTAAGCSSSMLVMTKKGQDPTVRVLRPVPASEPPATDARIAQDEQRWAGICGRFSALLAPYPARSRRLEIFTDAEADTRLAELAEIQGADAVVLHWVAGMLDYGEFRAAFRGKKVFWVLHDLNPFTGGCHYPNGCTRYRSGCGACPQLGSVDEKDLSRRIWLKKERALAEAEFTVIAPSLWMARCAAASPILAGKKIAHIPNGLPLTLYRPYDRAETRGRLGLREEDRILLFGADSLANPRKGFAYLRAAVKSYRQRYDRNITLVCFGRIPKGFNPLLDCRLFAAGFVEDDAHMARLYSMADVYVLPSVEENLPNTAIEAAACGLPVAGFRTGGIPEIVAHEATGHLSESLHPDGLADSIAWCLENGANPGVRLACRQKAQGAFALERQVRAFLERLAPAGLPPAVPEARDARVLTPPSPDYRVSAVVSTYNAASYLSACLENLASQTIYRKGELEIVIINSGSEQEEEAIATHFASAHPHVVYRRTERETLYAAWNRAIDLAQGGYIVNTNTDDSLREDALERLADALDAHPDADLAYADCALTRVANDGFEAPHAHRVCDYPPFHPGLGMLCCLLGPHPMWRRTVFEKIGRFDASFKAAGDYDFQMRFIQAGCSAVHVPEVLSLFFQNEKGLTLASECSRREAQRIERRYRASMPIERLYAVDPGDAEQAANAWVAQGNLSLSWKCPWLDNAPPLFDYAAACYRSALDLRPLHAPALRNLCALMAVHGQWDQCRDLLARRGCPDEDLNQTIARKSVPRWAPVQVAPAIAPRVHSQGALPALRRGDGPHHGPAGGRTPARASGALRVLYDISVLGLGTLYESARTGIFRVVENVARGLAGSKEIDLAFCATQARTERNPETVDGCRKYLAGRSEFGRIPFFDSELPEADLFHSPFHAIPRDVRTPVRFLTVYDLIPILFPQYMPAGVTLLQKLTLATLKPDDRLLCISRATQSDLCRVSGIAPERTRVTYLAADPRLFHPGADEREHAAVRVKYGLGDAPYWLSLCTLEPRKNIDTVVRAFGRLSREGAAGRSKLVLVGTRGWDFDRIFKEIDRHGELEGRVVTTGYVADEDLAALYGGALAFVYLSLYEGFGLPPLEALQCGTPVIASNSSSLPEVVGDAGILIDPHDLDGLCMVMREVADNRDLRGQMSERARGQASRFSWERCVAQTMAAYHSAVRPDENKGHVDFLTAA